MSDTDSEPPGAAPPGPFGYGVCDGCGAAVRRRALIGEHTCDPERYAAHQALRLHWRRGGFDEAVRAWLASPAGRFAEYYARRLVNGGAVPRPGEA
jgi:hypothetical protein